jgi:hypothetical protein
MQVYLRSQRYCFLTVLLKCRVYECRMLLAFRKNLKTSAYMFVCPENGSRLLGNFWKLYTRLLGVMYKKTNFHNLLNILAVDVESEQFEKKKFIYLFDNFRLTVHTSLFKISECLLFSMGKQVLMEWERTASFTLTRCFLLCLWYTRMKPKDGYSSVFMIFLSFLQAEESSVFCLLL